MRMLLVILSALYVMGEGLPKGFKPLFNGKNLKGWHISETNHHGNTKAWKIENGVVSVTQDTPGNGGILLTDKEYANYEMSFEVKPDFGCDGGVFLRSTEKGEAYQVMLDYLEGGVMGGVYGEKIPEIMVEGVGTGMKMDRGWMKYWKKDNWNLMRIRVEGEVPHIEVWINGQKTADWTDSANHAKTGTGRGMIALQAHRTDPKAKSQRWIPGGYHRFRNVGIRELT